MGEILRHWGRIGALGFGGPPVHIAMLRELCVVREGWMAHDEFEDAVAACNLLPGPASTQLAILCARRVGGVAGALVGGLAFIVPGLVLILALAVVFLAAAPPVWIRGAGAGAGAAVAAVALRVGASLVPASWRRSRAHQRWGVYALLGGVVAATLGPWLVLVLLASGVCEVLAQSRIRRAGGSLGLHLWPLLGLSLLARGHLRLPLRVRGGARWVVLAVATSATGGLGALAWVAFKVGALSYGGGFVIIPLMQSEAVNHFHWMSSSQFLNAVALGQITPGPLVQSVAVVGYAAHGIGGGLLAAAVAFSPSFVFVLVGGGHFDRLRADPRVQGFLDGAGPAAIGAIVGSAIPLAIALQTGWQFALLGVSGVALLVLRLSAVWVLLGAGVVGAVLALAGAPL